MFKEIFSIGVSWNSEELNKNFDENLLTFAEQIGVIKVGHTFTLIQWELA